MKAYKKLVVAFWYRAHRASEWNTQFFGIQTILHNYVFLRVFQLYETIQY